MTVHSFARGKLPQQNMMNDVRLFSRVLDLGNSMRIDKRQSIQLCPPHTGSTSVMHNAVDLLRISTVTLTH